jgi:hypothetical protein
VRVEIGEDQAERRQRRHDVVERLLDVEVQDRLEAQDLQSAVLSCRTPARRSAAR